tara:strand:- start:322 stop:555 length:234 start_codon:yes stop_codon:yes gene_type:complete
VLCHLGGLQPGHVLSESTPNYHGLSGISKVKRKAVERGRENGQTCRKKGPPTIEVQVAMHTRIAMGVMWLHLGRYLI